MVSQNTKTLRKSQAIQKVRDLELTVRALKNAEVAEKDVLKKCVIGTDIDIVKAMLMEARVEVSRWD